MNDNAHFERPLSKFFIKGTGFIFFIGGGGKTTLIYKLADILFRNGKKVVTGTTTHILVPSPKETQHLHIGSPEASNVRALANKYGIVTLAFKNDKQKGKLVGHAPEYFRGLWKQNSADVFLVEADGAAGRPLKFHVDSDPVVDAEAERVIAVVGAEVLGAPLSEDIFHRSKLFAETLWHQINSRIEIEHVAELITEFYFKPNKISLKSERIVFINKVSSDERKDNALKLAALLLKHSEISRVGIGDIHSEYFEEILR